MNINSEFKNYLNLNYYDLVKELQNKYGLPKQAYFHKRDCKNKVKEIRRTNEGLYIHHVKEYLIYGLSNNPTASNYPFEYQQPINLVYCNLLEHTLLHIKIFEENENNKGIAIFDNMIPLINSYMFNIATKPDTHMTNYYYQQREFCLEQKQNYCDLINYLFNVMLIKNFKKYYFNIYKINMKIIDSGYGLNKVLSGFSFDDFFKESTNILQFDISYIVKIFFEKMIYGLKKTHLLNTVVSFNQKWIVDKLNKHIQRMIDVCEILIDYNKPQRSALTLILSILKQVEKGIKNFNINKELLSLFNSVAYHLLFIFNKMYTDEIEELYDCVYPIHIFLDIHKINGICEVLFKTQYRTTMKQNNKKYRCANIVNCTNKVNHNHIFYCDECKNKKVICYLCKEDYCDVNDICIECKIWKKLYGNKKRKSNYVS